MKLIRPLPVVMAAFLVFAGLYSLGRAQTTPPPSEFSPTIITGLAHENVPSSGARSPGIMVSQGVARAQSTVDLTRTQSNDITETAETEDKDFRELFVEGAVDVLLQQFEDLLFYFANLLLERAGLPPVEPGVDNDNGNTNDNDNDNGNDNSNSNANDNDNGNDNANANDNDNENTNANNNGNTNDNGNDNTRPTVVRKQLVAPQRRAVVPK